MAVSPIHSAADSTDRGLSPKETCTDVNDVAKEAVVNEAASSSAAIDSTKKGYVDEEDGELDYDEGDVHGGHLEAHEDPEAISQDMQKLSAVEEGEIASDVGDEEEGEIVSDTESANKNKEDVEEGEVKDEIKVEMEDGELPEESKDEMEDGEIHKEDLEEGQLDEGIERGTCRWGPTCRFLHPGINDKGNYMMHRPPGMYPTAFGKPPPPIECCPLLSGAAGGSQPELGGGEVADDMFEPLPQVILTPDRPIIRSSSIKETAWERGLKKAKEIKQAADRRKEEDENFEEKRLSLTVGDIRAPEADRSDMKKRPMKERIGYREPEPKPYGGYYDHGDRHPPPMHSRQRPMEGRPMMDDRRYRDRRESSPPPRRYERERPPRRDPRRSPSPRRHRERIRSDQSESGLRDKRRELPTRDIPRNATSRDTVLHKGANQQASRSGEASARDIKAVATKKDERPRSGDKVAAKQPAEAVVDSSTGGGSSAKASKSGASKTMHSAEQWRDPWMRTTQPTNRAKSPNKSDNSPYNSYSSFSSSVTSGSDFDSDSLSDDSDDTGSDSDSSQSSHGSAKVPTITKKKMVQDPRKLATERMRSQNQSNEAQMRPIDPRRALANRKPTSPKTTSSSADSSTRKTTADSPRDIVPKSRNPSDVGTEKVRSAPIDEKGKPRGRSYYDSAIRYDSYEQWRNSQSAAAAPAPSSKHLPSSTSSSTKNKAMPPRKAERDPRVQSRSAASSSSASKSIDLQQDELTPKNGGAKDASQKSGVNRFDRVKASSRYDDDDDDDLNSSSSFGSPTLKVSRKAVSNDEDNDDDDDDDSLSDSDSDDTDSDSDDSDSDLSANGDLEKIRTKAKASSSLSLGGRLSAKSQLQSNPQDPRYSRNKMAAEGSVAGVSRQLSTGNKVVAPLDPRRASASQVTSSSTARRKPPETSATPPKVSVGTKRPLPSNEVSSSSSPGPPAAQAPNSTVARKEELLKELKAVEDAIARKRSKVD